MQDNKSEPFFDFDPQKTAKYIKSILGEGETFHPSSFETADIVKIAQENKVDETFKKIDDYMVSISQEETEGFFSSLGTALKGFISKIVDFTEIVTPYLEKELAKLHEEKPETKVLDISVAISYIYTAAALSPEELERVKADIEERRAETSEQEALANVNNNAYYFLFPIALKTLHQLKAELEKQAAALGEKPEKIKVQGLKEFKFAVDKVNSSIWNNADEITTTALTIPLKAEPDKSRREVTNNVILWLDDLKNNAAIQRLNQYDLRVYMAIGNLFNAGNAKISIKDIHKAMGNKSNLAAPQRQKILQSIEKMSSLRITVDTTEEQAAGYRYPDLHITRRNLLYTKVDVVLKKGQETEVIELMEEPVLFQFAIARNQYTTIEPALLCSPVSKTETTLAIENYLIKRITERGKGGKTILLSTVYEKAGIKTKQQRYKARDKIKTLLDYWKEQGFIFDYDICMNDNKAAPEECIKIKQQ